ncbi:EutN/CcmL family microcompartment protein [Mucisphaera calidilacus]|uniref:Ethanolamine utilization protein EutN n=1 Tax=Mucisphaera calidilacus TaxID=2527982 RepID=A0A518BYG0_9BACT|nr:EutN/CcmL family microcompartment protein [Mucisphaera calidilacus]QDU72011.1 Ethanolamine utilization protein EutN [Mucisphaera calidilacus]
MQLAVVRGRATSTIKHPSLDGAKMLLVEMLGNAMQPVGDPVLVLDNLGAGRDDTVVITSDGLGIRDLLHDDSSPARWWTLSIVDPNGIQVPRK